MVCMRYFGRHQRRLEGVIYGNANRNCSLPKCRKVGSRTGLVEGGSSGATCMVFVRDGWAREFSMVLCQGGEAREPPRHGFRLPDWSRFKWHTAWCSLSRSNVAWWPPALATPVIDPLIVLDLYTLNLGLSRMNWSWRRWRALSCL